MIFASGSDMALTTLTVTSSITYMVTVAGMIRAYGFRGWRKLGYGTGVDRDAETEIEAEANRRRETGFIETDHLI